MEGARGARRGMAREIAVGPGTARVADGWRMDPGSGAACTWRASGRVTWHRGGDAGARAGPAPCGVVTGRCGEYEHPSGQHAPSAA